MITPLQVHIFNEMCGLRHMHLRIFSINCTKVSCDAVRFGSFIFKCIWRFIFLSRHSAVHSTTPCVIRVVPLHLQFRFIFFKVKTWQQIRNKRLSACTTYMHILKTIAFKMNKIMSCMLTTVCCASAPSFDCVGINVWQASKRLVVWRHFNSWS